MNNISKLISTLYVILIMFAYNNSYADDKKININEVEEALGIKTQSDCTTPPCTVDVDSLLADLIDESKKEENSDTKNESDVTVNDSYSSLISMDRAKIIILNKITAKSELNVFKIGEVKFFGNLSIEVKKCIKNTDPFNDNNLMLISVSENKIEDENRSIFYSWVFSANPSISTLEHPVYELIPVNCTSAKKK